MALKQKIKFRAMGLLFVVFIGGYGGFGATVFPAFAHPQQTEHQSTAQKTHIRIGVLAYRGAARATRTWTATAAYLDHKLPDLRFKIVPLTIDTMKESVRTNKVDFIITNPGNYVELEARFGISRIATLQKDTLRSPAGAVGSVIFTKRTRTDIQRLSDLKGKVFAAIAPEAFGGFQVPLREFLHQGISPYKDFAQISFLGFPMDNIVFAVRGGVADAGVVRTCLLEHMAEEGKINFDSFKILNPQHHPGFQCASSTELYPDWPFAKTRNTSLNLAKRVAQALLSLPSDSQAARTGNYAGWTVPLDYQPVHDLFKELKIGPYEYLGKISPIDLIARYWEWLVFVAAAFLWTVGHVVRSEYLVKIRTGELNDSNEQLQKEMAVRRNAEEQDRRHEAELEHVSRQSIMGELASGLSHEVIQPLGSIVNYARGSELRAKSGTCDQAQLLKTMRQMASEAERAAEIIRRIRRFLQKDTDERTALDINETLREAVSLFSWEARHNDTQVVLDLDEKVPKVFAERIQIQQVILNLMRNAMEEMVSTNSAKRKLEVCTQNVGGAVKVSVRDYGPGLSREAIDRMFEPFYTTKSNGMGLGLSISRSIIEAHESQLTAHSEDGGGTVFSFVLASANKDSQVTENSDDK
ncbi:sensor histidine kinase [Varunaivibrio sulfuroxidans]|nr:sensor histidine kinase [Varunaivibrio sulfuroxidans]